MTKEQLLQSAAYRALRTFVQTFIGVILSAWIALPSIGGQRITGLWDVLADQWDYASGAGLIAAIVAIGWRTLLDPTPVPSLKDPTDDANIPRSGEVAGARPRRS